jgi:hypothetical protein
LSGHAKGVIEKMRSKFFQRAKSSGAPVTQPAGCGGKTSGLNKLAKIKWSNYFNVTK